MASSFVVLKAIVPPFADSNFSTYFEWDTINPDGSSSSAGQAVSGSPDKWEVKRDTPGQYIVRLKTIADHKEVLRINVWIVWATISSVAPPIASNSASIEDGDTTVGDGLQVTGGYDFTHTIAPASIITAVDHPDLTGSNVTNPPGGNHWTGEPLSGGANKKWDNSRQMETKVLNPESYPNSALPNGPFWSSQPINYPTDPVEGNDDRSTGDETNDPYANSGVLTGSDRPTMLLRNSTGSDNDTFEVRLAFKEFTRLEIAGKWYNISDYYLWRFYAKFKRVGGVWTDNGSSGALDNAGF